LAVVPQRDGSVVRPVRRRFRVPVVPAFVRRRTSVAWRKFFSLSAPAIDVTEDEKTYKITAEVPGLDQKNLDVSVSGDMLTLKGEKHHEKEEKDKNHYLSERAYGSFQRSFAFPESVNRDKITADLSKGVLTITLPKTAEAQKPQKKIEVKAAN
jgi:HSP20 family protein